MTLTKKDGEESKTKCAKHALAFEQWVSAWLCIRSTWGELHPHSRDPDLISLGRAMLWVCF